MNFRFRPFKKQNYRGNVLMWVAWVAVLVGGVPKWIEGGDPPLTSYFKDDSNERFEFLKYS